MMKHILKTLPWVALLIFFAATIGQNAIGEAGEQELSFYKDTRPKITSYRYASLMGSADNLTNSTSKENLSNGLVKCYLDKDGDGYGDINKIIISKNPPKNCVATYNDCNDNNAKVHPKSKEICGDEIDQNCDGSDEVCSKDLDLDGDGMSESEGDCNDQDPTIYRGAYDICGDGIDQCCSGEDAVCPEDHESDSTIAKSGSKNIVPDSKKNDSASKQSAQIHRKSILVTKKIKIDNRTVTSSLKTSGSTPKKSVLSIKGGKLVPRKSNRTLTPEEIFLGFEENVLNSKIAFLSPAKTFIDGENTDPNSKKTTVGFRGTDSEKAHLDFEQTILNYIESKQVTKNEDLRSKEVDKDKDGATVGQGDCNDNDPAVYPGAFDACGDGIDQDCYQGDADCPDSSDYITQNQDSSIGLVQHYGGVDGSTSGDISHENKTTLAQQRPIYLNDNSDGTSLSKPESVNSNSISTPEPVYPDNNPEPVYPDNNPEPVYPDNNVTGNQNLSGYGIIGQSEDKESAANSEDTDDVGSTENLSDSGSSNSSPVPPIIIPHNDSGSNDFDNDGVTENEGDCNDKESAIHPGADEICGDGIDQDCNGKDLACSTDPNDIDNDKDGFTENQNDCDDNNSDIHPDAKEVCGDGIDQDCNGKDLACSADPNDIDNDKDGFTENQNDCNDENPNINPDAKEICDDSIDQNCNGEINEGCEEPPTPSEILPPKLLSPKENRTMDNGCDVGDDGIKWDFSWSPSQGANRYEIEILHGEEKSIISQVTGSHSFTFECSENSNEIPGCMIDHLNAEGWRWHVRAGNAGHGEGQWSDWSKSRSFNVEPLNTDCGEGYNITINNLYPDSGASLFIGDEVSIDFSYHVPGQGDVRIFSRPFSNGDPTPHQRVDQAPVYQAGDGRGENSFTISNGDRIRVDQIQFTIESLNGRILWRHLFDVDYEFNNQDTIPDQEPVNTAPTITPINNQTTTVGTPLTVEFTIDDGETDPSDLSVSVRSRNKDQNMVPNDKDHITVGGNGSNRFTTITPEATGSATITIRVNDGSISTETSFGLTVSSASDSEDEPDYENTPPTVSSIPSQTTTVDTPLTLEFTIDDQETNPSELIVAARSNNQVVVSDDRIELGGNGAELSVTITPRSVGNAAITITVSDGSEKVHTRFGLEVTARR
jgi:hypothetical protein